MSTQTEFKPINRRSFLKKTVAAILAACASVPIYSFIFERFWLDITHVDLTFPELPNSFSGMRIVHISDLHIGEFYKKEHLKKVVAQVNQLKPDLLCFTGDLVEDNVDILKECIPILQQLHAPLGKIAILGNHDYKIGKQGVVSDTLQKSGFTFLRNQHTALNKMESQLFIAGVDDMFGGVPNIPASVQGIPPNQFTILLAHEPDLADTAVQYPVQLQLSGHSHGGQVRLPFYGPIFTPDGAKKYVRGLKKLQSSKLILYVNRGIGTTFLPFRFNCRPEITVMTLSTSF
jgi:predicted MPP superfamily phosphohydrolase